MNQFKLTKRQSEILNMLEDDGFVATEAMVSMFEVTPQTVRRDLNELAQRGLLTRFHGGAGQVKSAENPPYEDRVATGVEVKQKIATMTASLVPNGASIFLSTGTTIEAVSKALLGHQKLHIFTNNLNVAKIMTRNDSFQIIVACGQVRHHDGGITGPFADDFIRDFRMDIGIVGISGVDQDGSLLEYETQETKTTKTILQNSRKTILVADRYKFGRPAMNRVGHLRDLDSVVTNGELDPHFMQMCETEDVDVHIAG